MATGGGPVGPGGSRALHGEPSSGGSADLFGREPELGALAAALDQVAAGSGRVVGIVGEAGIGKTRLAEEAVALAAAHGFTVLTGRTPVREMAVAYAPLLEAIGDHLRRLDPVARAATTSGLAELGTLFGSLVPGRFEPLPDPALEQARWFEAVARLLERIAEHGPLLLFVDDVHEADAASLALLHYLCRRLHGQPAVVLLTYRSDADSQRVLRDLLASVRRHARLDEVPLVPLQRAHLAELAAARLGGPAGEALLDLLERRAGGVPLFAETMLTGLRGAGQLFLTGGCWAPAPGAVADIPALARDVVLRTLDRLEADERQVLELLAIAGDAVSPDRLAAVGGDDPALAVRIDRLRAAGLVDEVIVGGRVAYRLHHPVLGEVAHAELGERERRRLHAQYAAVLERDEPRDLQRLARHYRSAGYESDPERARQILAAAGAQALAVHANREAVAHLSAALELQRASGRTDGLGGLLEQLADALERIGEHAAAVSLWEEALPVISAAGDALGTGRVHRRLAAAEWERGRLEQVRAHLARGLDVLETRAPSRELAELRRTEVWLRTWMYEFDAADHAARALADLAARLDAPRATVEALLAEARLRLAQVRPEAAVRTARRALAAADAVGDPLLRWHAHNMNVIATVWDGHHRVVRDHALTALDLARKLAVPALELRSEAMTAAADFFAGDWQSAFARAAGVLQRAPLVGQPRPAVHSVAIVAILGSYRGDTAAAERTLAEVKSAYGRLDHDLGVQVLLVPAEALLALGRDELDVAVRLIDDALPRVRDGFGGWLLLGAGEVYLRAGRWESALAVAPRIAAMAAAHPSAMAGEALRIEGVAHAELGASDRALACLAEARETFAALETPFFGARAGMDWGRLRGGDAGAEAILDSLAVFQRLEAGRYADQARAVLRTLGVSAPRRHRRLSGPLSVREREVACLAAEGLTATEIAERLVISPHTARTHLKRIHERLAVSSRAELTRYVVDAGWLGRG